MKKISVIIPMYNSFHMMEKNLNILSQQKSAIIEIIIVDDCSPDGSYYKAKEFADNSNLNIIVIQNEKNGGPGYSRNNGIKYATGDYITFIDSDDYFSENFSDVLAPKLEENWDCIIFNFMYVDIQGNLISKGKTLSMKNVHQGEVSTKTALVYSKGAPWGKIYKKDIIEKNNIQFLNLFRSEDLPFTKHAIAMSKKIYYCEECLYQYVQVSTSLMHNDNLTDEKNSQLALEYLKENLEISEFREELLAIELKESLNNTVLIKVKNKEKRRVIKDYIKKNFKKDHIRNTYFSKEPMYFKIISYCSYFKLIFFIALILKYKNYKHKRNTKK